MHNNLLKLGGGNPVHPDGVGGFPADGNFRRQPGHSESHSLRGRELYSNKKFCLRKSMNIPYLYKKHGFAGFMS